MHAYSVYGLGLQSEFPIPELLESGSAVADIVVRRASVPVAATSRPPTSAQPSEADDSWAERRAQGAETLCVFAGVGRYLVRGGHLVLVDPEPGVDFAVVRHLLLGPVLAHLLWQRGVFALHASVVGVRGRHLAFLGISGEGKSTIAAALEASGHMLVCDDVAALVQRAGRVEALPGFPRIRLHADSLRSIGDDPARHPFVHDQIDKRLKPVGSFATGAVLLDAIYVLATGAALALERLPPGVSVVEILRHTYYAHQFAPLYGFQHHLQRAAAIAELVPSFRLARPKDLALLPELVGFIEARAGV